MGGWLPPGLRSAQQFHLAHHDIPGGRYNVFLPLFDALLGTIKPPSTEIQLPSPLPCCWRMPSSIRKVMFQGGEFILFMWSGLLVLDYHLLYGRKLRVKLRSRPG